MTQPPQLTTYSNLTSTYNASSARCCRMSYTVSHTPPQFSRHTQATYRRKGDSTARDNWILGKGSEADGWDGWSLVQGESRYWESKLQKPEYRGKCGGAAANRLSEETIVKTLSKNSNSDLLHLPPGSLVSEFLKEKRITANSRRADALHAELLGEDGGASVAPPKGLLPRVPTAPASSPRRTAAARQQTSPIHNYAKDYWDAKKAAKESEELVKQQRFEALLKQKAAKEQQKRKPLTRAFLLASGNPIEGTFRKDALPPVPISPRSKS